MPPKFKAYPTEYYQSQLFPENVLDLLPEDHDCLLFQDLFQQLDIRKIEETYSNQGQRSYPPRQIISILVYAYSYGVFSALQMERRSCADLRIMYIAGWHYPVFWVLSDFRKSHGPYFRDCFRQTVQLTMALDLASLSDVSLDGSKFKANSSKPKAMNYKPLQESEQQLYQDVEDLIEQAGAMNWKKINRIGTAPSMSCRKSLSSNSNESRRWRRP